jgi:hypothetical protein
MLSTVCRSVTKNTTLPSMILFWRLLFIDSRFERSVESVKRPDKDTVRFVMAWKIQDIYPVCKTAFAAAYGLTVYQLEEASARCKGTGVKSKCCGHRKLCDANIPSFTYSEVEDIFIDNLKEHPGNLIHTCLPTTSVLNLYSLICRCYHGASNFMSQI